MPVLYRDAWLIALAKPSGLLVHRGWDNDPVVALDLAREAAGAYVYPVHRLDRGTSGVLLFALDAATAAVVHGAMERGEADKRYVALVRGVPRAAGVLDHPIPRTEGGERVPARTEYRPLGAAGRFGLVEARPLTGRLHQVRRHLKHLGHPVLGDANYGRGELNRLCREQYGLHRLALHAASLALSHPHTGAPLRLRAPLPDDLAGPVARIGLSLALCDIDPQG
jgi:tRNA pseudouridine65 synthase